MSNLACKCLPRLDGLPAAELGRLFPEPSNTAPLLSLLQESGIDGFNLRSIVVSKDDAPILLLPLFETRFDLSTFVEGWIKKSLKVAGRLIPSLFRPRILGVGLLVGELSEIGIDPQIDAGTLESAFKMAFDALQRLAAELKSDIVALYNFSHYGGLPAEVLNTLDDKFSHCFPRLHNLPVNDGDIVPSLIEHDSFQHQVGLYQIAVITDQGAARRHQAHKRIPPAVVTVDKRFFLRFRASRIDPSGLGSHAVRPEQRCHQKEK